MEQRAAAEEQLRQSQKMQALGQLTGGIAHDFNNLLTVIQGSADMLCPPDLPEQKRVRFAQAIVQAASNAAALTAQLLAFARRQPLKPEQIDVNTLIAEMTELIDRVTGERIQVLDRAGAGLMPDRSRPDTAAGAQSSTSPPTPGTRCRAAEVLAIRTETSSRDDGTPMIAIAIEDSGTGMDAETIDRNLRAVLHHQGSGEGYRPRP